ncbi:Zinc finger CCCH domain-containing protein [Arachis hypogaea]|nr:Zinc finger CCCH domain-containing protein [Arachis hypogaea]
MKSGVLMTVITLWVCTEKKFLKVAYTHNEKNAIVGQYGMTDSYAKPILFCACNNNSLLIDCACFYRLLERSRMFTRTLLYWRWNWFAECMEMVGRA